MPDQHLSPVWGVRVGGVSGRPMTSIRRGAILAGS
jgi:hypothetical protein